MILWLVLSCQPESAPGLVYDNSDMGQLNFDPPASDTMDTGRMNQNLFYRKGGCVPFILEILCRKEKLWPVKDSAVILFIEPPFIKAPVSLTVSIYNCSDLIRQQMNQLPVFIILSLFKNG
jgi:hypothetical protein